MIGDFNLVRSASERKGITSGMTNKREMIKFNELIERCALRDIPVVGGSSPGTDQMGRLGVD